VRGEAGWASRKRHASRAEEMCGGGMSVDRSTVERERCRASVRYFSG
jgi:hypothetical protein